MQAIIIFLLLSIPFSCVLAIEPLTVVINEIAWMGTEKSYSDEWLELYNNSSVALTLEGWQLISGDGSPEINLEGEIPAGGFFLLEKTDDETLPDITADLIYKGVLHNEGEYLKLFGNGGNIIDEIDCSSGWFAGDNPFKKTMERKNPLLSGSRSSNWQTSQNPGGTPKAKNSQVPTQPSEEIPKEAGPISPPTSTETPPSEPESKVYPSNIFISEILPSPEGADAENEWIELFNGNSFEVALAGWQIRDTIGATETYTIPEGTKIGSNGFLVLLRPETKITLQNSGDGLELLNPGGEIIHQANYPKAPLGQSFNRSSTGWTWSETLTPGETNVVAEPEISKSEPSVSGDLIEKGDGEALAKISEGLPKSSSSLVIFFIALSIAVSSAIIVLFLKKRTATEEQL